MQSSWEQHYSNTKTTYGENKKKNYSTTKSMTIDSNSYQNHYQNNFSNVLKILYEITYNKPNKLWDVFMVKIIKMYEIALKRT